jgi:hypothetical protein
MSNTAQPSTNSPLLVVLEFLNLVAARRHNNSYHELVYYLHQSWQNQSYPNSGLISRLLIIEWDVHFNIKVLFYKAAVPISTMIPRPTYESSPEAKWPRHMCFLQELPGEMGGLPFSVALQCC